MGLSISILFLPILNYLSASKIVSISYPIGIFGIHFRCPITLLSSYHHAIFEVQSRYFRGSITLFSRFNHAIFEVKLKQATRK